MKMEMSCALNDSNEKTIEPVTNDVASTTIVVRRLYLEGSLHDSLIKLASMIMMMILFSYEKRKNINWLVSIEFPQSVCYNYYFYWIQSNENQFMVDESIMRVNITSTVATNMHRDAMNLHVVLMNLAFRISLIRCISHFE